MASSDVTSTGADRRFVKRAMSAPLLDREHELNLATRWREEGDEHALHELCTAYMRLVVAIAARFRTYGLPMSDLVQEGNVGLMLAAARFEPERELRFSTYATWWIRSCVQDYILRNWSIVRTGTTAAQKSLFFNLRRLRALLRDPTDGGLSPESRAYVAHSAARGRGRSRPHGLAPFRRRPLAQRPDRRSRRQRVAGPASRHGHASRRRNHDRPRPRHAPRMACRSPHRPHRPRITIIRERRLVEEGVTLETLGRKLGVSKERVRQIEHQALRKLRSALTRIVGDPEEAGLIPST